MFLKKHIYVTRCVSQRGKREREREMSSLWYQKAQLTHLHGEREQSERKAKGEGKDCRCDRSWRGRRYAIWVREEAEEMSREGYSSKTEG